MSTTQAKRTSASKQVSRAQRHVPLRRCVVCRKQRPQAELVRFYRDSAGQWQLDLQRKAGGRGAWLCAVAEGDQTACTGASPKTLQRFFRGQASRVYEMLQTNVLQVEAGNLDG